MIDRLLLACDIRRSFTVGMRRAIANYPVTVGIRNANVNRVTTPREQERDQHEQETSYSGRISTEARGRLTGDRDYSLRKMNSARIILPVHKNAAND